MTRDLLDFTDEDKAVLESQTVVVLAMLAKSPTTSQQFRDAGIPRFSSPICSLRAAGHHIDVERISRGSWLHTYRGFTPRIEVTEAMQTAYYQTEHWQSKRLARLTFDGFQCCWCKQSGCLLHVHHWFYELFAEPIEDLMTLCETCHADMHENKAIKVHFPRFVTPEIAARLACAE